MWYIRNLFVSIDQFGNALAGGNPDITVSARVGYFANHNPATRDAWNWRAYEWIIDTTFWPIDGKGHCHQAYHADAGELYYPQGYQALHLIGAIIIILTCPVICIFTYVPYLLGKRYPPYNPLKNIGQRASAAKREICGISEEIDEINFITPEITKSLGELVEQARDLHESAQAKLKS